MTDITIDKTEVLKVQDGDVVAVFIKGSVPIAEIERMCATLQNAFSPKRVTVKAFNAEMVEIKILRPE